MNVPASRTNFTNLPSLLVLFLLVAALAAGCRMRGNSDSRAKNGAKLGGAEQERLTGVSLVPRKSERQALNNGRPTGKTEPKSRYRQLKESCSARNVVITDHTDEKLIREIIAAVTLPAISVTSTVECRSSWCLVKMRAGEERAVEKMRALLKKDERLGVCPQATTSSKQVGDRWESETLLRCKRPMTALVADLTKMNAVGSATARASGATKPGRP